MASTNDARPYENKLSSLPISSSSNLVLMLLILMVQTGCGYKVSITHDITMSNNVYIHECNRLMANDLAGRYAS